MNDGGAVLPCNITPAARVESTSFIRSPSHPSTSQPVCSLI